MTGSPPVGCQAGASASVRPRVSWRTWPPPRAQDEDLPAPARAGGVGDPPAVGRPGGRRRADVAGQAPLVAPVRVHDDELGAGGRTAHEGQAPPVGRPRGGLLVGLGPRQAARDLPRPVHDPEVLPAVPAGAHERDLAARRPGRRVVVGAAEAQLALAQAVGAHREEAPAPARAPLEGDLVAGRRPRRVPLRQRGQRHPAQDGAVEVHRPDRAVAGEGQPPPGRREGRVADVPARDQPLQAAAARAAGEEDPAGAGRRLVGDDAVAPREGGVGGGRGGQGREDGRRGEQEGEEGAGGHCRTATPPSRRGCARRADLARVV